MQCSRRRRRREVREDFSPAPSHCSPGGKKLSGPVGCLCLVASLGLGGDFSPAASGRSSGGKIGAMLVPHLSAVVFCDAGGGEMSSQTNESKQTYESNRSV